MPFCPSPGGVSSSLERAISTKPGAAREGLAIFIEEAELRDRTDALIDLPEVLELAAWMDDARPQVLVAIRLYENKEIIPSLERARVHPEHLLASPSETA